MAKEITLEEFHWDWINSNDPEKRKLADELAPLLSIQQELRLASRANDTKKEKDIAKIIIKYRGPKDVIPNREYALKALNEIRAYTSGKPTNLISHIKSLF